MRRFARCAAVIEARLLATIALAAAATTAIACVGDEPSASSPASSDGSVSDSSDAGTEVDAADAGFTFCNTGTHAFCADFDRSAKPGDGFTSDVTVNGGTAALYSLDYVSPPMSARFTLPQTDAGTNPVQAYLGNVLPMTSRVAHFTWSMKHHLGADAGIGGAVSLQLVTATLNGISAVAIAVGGNGAMNAIANPAGTTTGYPFQNQIPPDTWVKVTLDVTFDATPNGHITVLFDDGTTTLTALDTVADTSHEATPTTLAFNFGGSRFGDSTESFDFDYDNFVIDLP